jgi:hypothetical protein
MMHPRGARNRRRTRGGGGRRLLTPSRAAGSVITPAGVMIVSFGVITGAPTIRIERAAMEAAGQPLIEGNSSAEPRDFLVTQRSNERRYGRC